MDEVNFADSDTNNNIYYQINDHCTSTANVAPMDYYESIDDQHIQLIDSSNNSSSSNNTSRSNPVNNPAQQDYDDIVIDTSLTSQSNELHEIDDENDHSVANSEENNNANKHKDILNDEDDYCCFDAGFTKEVFNSTKKFDDDCSSFANNSSLLNESKLLNKSSTARTLAATKPRPISKSTKKASPGDELLPPLPQAATSTSNLSVNAAGGAGGTGSGGDFDRNLNIRRSKRFVRQAPASSNLIIQEININSNQVTPSSSPNNPLLSKDQLAPTNSSCLSYLTKAMSTPSLLDKIKIESSIGADNGASTSGSNDKSNVLNSKINVKLNDDEAVVMFEDKNLLTQQHNLPVISTSSLNISKSNLNDLNTKTNPPNGKILKIYFFYYTADNLFPIINQNQLLLSF